MDAFKHNNDYCTDTYYHVTCGCEIVLCTTMKSLEFDQSKILSLDYLDGNRFTIICIFWYDKAEI